MSYFPRIELKMFVRSRQQWYGNTDPEHLGVVHTEIAHVWPGVRPDQVVLTAQGFSQVSPGSDGVLWSWLDILSRGDFHGFGERKVFVFWGGIFNSCKIIQPWLCPCFVFTVLGSYSCIVDFNPCLTVLTRTFLRSGACRGLRTRPGGCWTR